MRKKTKKNKYFAKRYKKNKYFAKRYKKFILINRLRKLKRYPLIIHRIFNGQQKALNFFPATKNFNLLKCLIKGFKFMLELSVQKQLFLLNIFKNILTNLLIFVDTKFKLFFFRILMGLILFESGQKQNILQKRNTFISERYLFFQTANAALFFAANSLYKKKSMLFSFIGLHTRNISANVLTNYIIQKLGQYFSIQEILKPMLFDLKISPLFDGFKIIVAGRITRKERAAFLIKKHGNLPLNKKSARIDYANAFKIMKFGMVGIKVFLYKKNTRPHYYQFNFVNENKLYTKNLCII